MLPALLAVLQQRRQFCCGIGGPRGSGAPLFRHRGAGAPLARRRTRPPQLPLARAAAAQRASRFRAGGWPAAAPGARGPAVGPVPHSAGGGGGGV